MVQANMGGGFRIGNLRAGVCIGRLRLVFELTFESALAPGKTRVDNSATFFSYIFSLTNSA
jgi:hypothetical protein